MNYMKITYFLIILTTLNLCDVVHILAQECDVVHIFTS